MHVGSFPYESVLISRLECFYNQTCVSQLLSYAHSPHGFSILNSSLVSSFNCSKDTIHTLANQLFVQFWFNETLFDSYFNKCHPLVCYYSYETRLSFIYILTTFLGLIGGLNIVFRLLSPLIIKSIYRLYHYIRNNNTEEQVTYAYRLRVFFIFLKQTLIENRQTTRFYLIILLTTFLVLIFYITLKKETVTITIQNPTIFQYEQLSTQYASILKCPCTRMANKYKTFITQLKPQYHEICSSYYVSDEWYTIIYNYISKPFIPTDDLIYFFNNFEFISELCKLSRNMLNVSLSSFEEAQFVTPEVLSHNAFDIRMETILEHLKTTLSHDFTETFQLIQTINYGNEFATIEQTNWKFHFKYIREYGFYNIIVDALTKPVTHYLSNYSCAIQPNYSVVYWWFFEEKFPHLFKYAPKIYRGCSIFDAMLRFNLKCFYDQMCVKFLSVYFEDSDKGQILLQPLFNHSSSLSMPNVTIKQLINQLFVVEWFEIKSFEKYFDRCQPSICQYSDHVRYNFLYIQWFAKKVGR
ncbi:unnamed protein product [Adineta ricciae]|uniref:Uncharacterized protein n=1 Tax=Adineta ricciae TaxID=249248 RepID=A0A815NX58_ADIRI|nr:unnamed protein product [Adineta ricciae]CAF1612708.1 unnamed protein product [Adineta ricciae]